MRRMRAAIAAVLLAVSPAQAHTVIEGVSGFPGGLLHPLLVPAHALLLVTLGLIAGQQARPQRRMLMLLFPLALIAAVALIVSAVAADTQNAILWLCAINGALLALARPLPLIASSLLIWAGGLTLMLDSVPAVLSVPETLSALSGTVFSAFLFFSAFALLSAGMRRPWQTAGRRIIGSWAAASAVLVLALRFMK